MAHELYTARDGKTAMAFVGETPWHGLGQRLTRDADLDTWKREAGFEWQAKLAPVLFTPDLPGARHMTMDGRCVIYRDDTHAPLAVVGDGYKPVQPAEVLEFFRPLTEEQGYHIHTAGVLRGGQKLWAMASNHTEGEVVPGDRVRSNLLFATSMDGSMRTHCGLTAVRVVCANTLGAALTEDGKSMVKISHRSTFDAEAVRQALGLARSTFEAFMAQARKLAEVRVPQGTAVDVCRELFGQPRLAKPTTARETAGFDRFMSKIATPTTIEHRTTQKVLALFNGAGRGANHPGVAGTAWGLLNAITEQIDHHAGRTADTRLDSAWFGQGNDMKQQALEALLTL